MKLFGNFEAVKFREENLIFITHNRYLYYIYSPRNNYWRKYWDAGNISITVNNYDEVRKEELMNAMGGRLPQRETDIMRLCNPSQLCIRDMLNLLEEDYPKYMSDESIYYTIHNFLIASNICHKSYAKLRKLLDNAVETGPDNSTILFQIQKLSFDIIGRDIYKREIGIVDGHDSSSYFWIMPVRVVDFSDTNDIDSVAEMRSIEISIEEDDVAQYLTPFLYKHFDRELKANKWRENAEGFEWYLTHNFFTHDSMERILDDIRDTVDALSSNRENEFTAKLRKKRGTETYQLLYAKGLNEEQIAQYNASRPTEDDTETALVIDFYNRFLYRMEYMMRVSKENGYDLISFMGP